MAPRQEVLNRMSRIIQVAIALLALGAMTACAPQTPQDPRLSGPSAVDLTRMASAPGAPQLTARSAADVAGVVRSAVRYAGERLPTARGLRLLEISAIPYLRRSPEGAVFLRQPFPRALARGTPAQNCPAAATSSPGATSVIQAAEDALTRCLGLLSARGADATCGCRLLAADNALVAPRRDFAFAPGVTAFLIRDRTGGQTGAAERLIAESEPADDGGESVILRTAAGPVGALALNGETAEMRLAPAPEVVWRGTRRMFGYRRGRMSERMVLTSDDGRSVRLLIGVEDRDAVAAQ